MLEDALSTGIFRHLPSVVSALTLPRTMPQRAVQMAVSLLRDQRIESLSRVG